MLLHVYEPGRSGVPLAKGSCWRAFLAALPDLHGRHAPERVLAALPDDLAKTIRSGGILPQYWYPLDWFKTTYATARRVLEGGPRFARDIGKSTTLDDLSGIYRVFLHVVSPQYFLSKAPLMFNSYYDTGKMVVFDPQPRSVRARWEGCFGFDTNLWEDLLGVAEGALTAAGAKLVQVQVAAGGGPRDTRCEMHATWR